MGRKESAFGGVRNFSAKSQRRYRGFLYSGARESGPGAGAKDHPPGDKSTQGGKHIQGQQAGPARVP